MKKSKGFIGYIVILISFIIMATILNAFRNLGAEVLIFFGVFEKINHLLQILLGIIIAGDVIENHPLFI